MNAEKIITDLQKSLSAVNESFRKPTQKSIQIFKRSPDNTELNTKKDYAGPSWYPEAKIFQLKKQAEAEELESALNSLSAVDLKKAISKKPSVNLDYWYAPKTGIFI